LKHIVFVILLLSTFGGLFLGSWLISLKSPNKVFDHQILIPLSSNDSITIAKQNGYDSIFFCEFRNCGTICSNTLPILEATASKYESSGLRIYFIDLSEFSKEERGFLKPEAFPHIRWITIPKAQQREILKTLGLEQWDKNHHSSRLLVHLAGTNELTWVESAKNGFYEALKFK